MRTAIVAVLLPLALSTGCASAYKQRINQDLWERELRLQEDCIYRLRWALEDKQHELDEANLRIQTLTKETGTLRDRGSSGPNLTVPQGIFGPSGGGRGGDAPVLPPAPTAPEVQPGKEFTPGRSGRNPKGPVGGFSSAERPTPALTPASYSADVDNPLRASERLDPDLDAERIVLNPGLTGALDAAGTTSDSLLSVDIEQRDAHDQRVLAPGDLSIVVVDPALEGSAARIARWDFDSDEVARHVHRNRDGGSLKFELPWPTPPQHGDLRLFVRFTTFDGRRLEANLPIEVPLSDFGFANRGWRKAASPLAEVDRPESEDTASKSAGPSTPYRRSVYETDGGNATPSRDRSPREAARHPSWSPNR